MARVRIDMLLDQYKSEMKKSLEAAIKEAVKVENGQLRIDDQRAFRIFKNKLESKIGSSAYVPDSYISQ